MLVEDSGEFYDSEKGSAGSRNQNSYKSISQHQNPPNENKQNRMDTAVSSPENNDDVDEELQEEQEKN